MKEVYLCGKVALFMQKVKRIYVIFFLNFDIKPSHPCDNYELQWHITANVLKKIIT